MNRPVASSSNGLEWVVEKINNDYKIWFIHGQWAEYVIFPNNFVIIIFIINHYQKPACRMSKEIVHLMQDTNGTELGKKRCLHKVSPVAHLFSNGLLQCFCLRALSSCRDISGLPTEDMSMRNYYYSRNNLQPVGF
jgi:hypothetical protein